MKKIIILCYLFLFMFTYSYGQLNDVKTFGTNADDYPLDLLIGHSNEIVISGAYEVSFLFCAMHDPLFKSAFQAAATVFWLAVEF